jgi:hypothetical protein
MKQSQLDAIAELSYILKPDIKIYCILRSVSHSGMSRVIDLAIVENRNIRRIGSLAAKAMNNKYEHNGQGIKIRGCGMDMGFNLVHNLGCAIFNDGNSFQLEWL